MPSITIKDVKLIKEFLNDKNEYPFFIETGSHVGITLNNLREHFKKLRSVELLPEFYEHCQQRKRTEGWYNVELYHGDSSKVLPTMLEGLDGNAVFFLDGHRSGGDINKGHKDCPLLEELYIIKEKRPNYNDLIIIDDFRLFGTTTHEDWKDITLENVGSILDNKSYYELNDRVIITNESTSL